MRKNDRIKGFPSLFDIIFKSAIKTNVSGRPALLSDYRFTDIDSEFEREQISGSETAAPYIHPGTIDP